MNIYNIKKEYEEIMNNPNYWDHETGEITEDWEKALKENQDNIESKAENIARYMRNLEWDNEAYKNEVERLNKLKKSNDNKVKWLKKLLDYALDWKELKTELFKFSYRKSETAKIENKELLPKKFITEQLIEKIAWLPEIKKYLKEEIEARIEEYKNDWKAYNEEDIKMDVYMDNWLSINFNRNLQIK